MVEKKYYLSRKIPCLGYGSKFSDTLKPIYVLIFLLLNFATTNIRSYFKYSNFMKTNKYHIVIVLLTILYGLNGLNAQIADNNLRNQAKVKWSTPYEEPSNSDLQKIVATEGGGFYALRIRKGGALGTGSMKAIIEYYDNSMKLVRSKELDLEYKGKDRFLKDVVMLQRKLWLLTYFYNEKHEKTYLFAQQINSQTLSLSKDIVKISEQDKTNRERQDVFNYAISRDSSKIVVFTRQPGEKRQQEFSLTVFDSDFNEVWSKDAKLPFGKNNFSVDEYQVDKNGNVFLLGVIYAEGTNRLSRSGKPTYQYDLIAYMRDSMLEVHEYKIDLKDRFVTDLTFRPADDGDLVFSGFYSDKGASSVKGTCFFKINPKTKDMTSVSTREFDLDFLTSNLSEKNKERAKAAAMSNNKEKEAELPSYSLDKLILRSDGGVIMIAEQYFIEERYNNNNNRFGNPYGYSYGWYDPFYSPWYDPYGYRYGNNNRQADYYFNYNDIIVVNIRPDGEIEWSARIPKRQMSKNDGGIYSSYSMSTVADKLYFIYNEDPRNLDPAKKKIYTDEPDKYSVVVLAEIDRSGQVKKAPLFQNKEEGVITRPKICRQIGKRNMAIYGEQGRNYKFGLLDFE